MVYVVSVAKVVDLNRIQILIVTGAKEVVEIVPTKA